MVKHMLVGGDILLVHNPTRKCMQSHCCIHNPSNHLMAQFKQYWRSDRQIVERICPHGIGHPDPDFMRYILKTKGEKDAHYEYIHGCDGCCKGAYTHDFARKV